MKTIILLLLIFPFVTNAFDFQTQGYSLTCDANLIDPQLTECREYLNTFQIGQTLQFPSGATYVVTDNTNALTAGQLVFDNIIDTEGSFSGFLSQIFTSFTTNTITNLILNQLLIFGLAVLAILGAIASIALAYLVYKYGKRVLFDNSIILGGYYLRKVPIQGYNRWRSQAWNFKNKPWEKKT